MRSIRTLGTIMRNENLTKKDFKWILPTFLLLGILFCGEVWSEYSLIFHGIVWIVVVSCVAYLIWAIVQLTKNPSEINRYSPNEESIALKDGRDYKIELDKGTVALLHRQSGECEILKWEEVTAVYILAIDRFPIGSISFMLHKGNNVLEIPTDAEGNEALLRKMQDSLPGFDNQELIESMGMLHGFKKLWISQILVDTSQSGKPVDFEYTQDANRTCTLQKIDMI